MTDEPQDRSLQRLGRFLQQQAPRDPVATRADLWHLAPDDQAGELTQYDIEDLSEEVLLALAADVYEDAADAAQAFPGPQRFALRLFRGNRKRAQGQHVWMVEGNGGGAELVLAGSEPATNAGITRAVMRHLEVREKTAALMQMDVYKILVGQLKSKDDALQASDSRRIELFELTESLVAERHTRDLETKRMEKWEDRKDEALETVKLLLPSFARHISKKIGGPEIHTLPPELLEMKTLVRSLNAQQLSSMIVSLTQPQQINFLQLIKHWANEDKQQAETSGGTN